MSASEITIQRPLRRVGSRAARAVTVIWALAAIGFVPCASASAAGNVFWTNNDANTIGHANLNVNQNFVGLGTGRVNYVAVDGQHVYWSSANAGTIGVANLDGTQVNQSLITGATVPLGVAVDSQHIYWVNEGNGTIGRANLDGTGVNQTFMSVPGVPAAIAINGQHIYWTDNSAGTIGEASLDGTTVNSSLISGADGPVALTTDSQSIYWTNLHANTIGQANLDGSNVDQSFVVGANDPSGIAVDAYNVYWSNNGDDTIGQAGIGKSFRDVNQAFITGVSGSQGLARDANHLYWGNGGVNHSIGRADINPSVVTTGNQPFAVAVDSKHIYWTNSTDNTIGRSNLDGTGANQSLIRNAHFPEGIAVDAQHIYWTNAADNTIGVANLNGGGVNQNLIQNAGGPQGVAVDSQHIYWSSATDNTIGRANLDGTGVDQTFILNASGPFGVAVDGEHIYWANRASNAIGRANIDGTSANQTFIVSPDGNLAHGPDNPLEVAIDGQHIYWASDATDAIAQANLDGSGLNNLLITGAVAPTGVAARPGPAPAHTYHVAPGGSATRCAANSQARPFATIQAALACAHDGDVIDLAPSGSAPYPGIGMVSHSVTIQAGSGGNARSVTVDLSQPDNSSGPMTVPATASVTLRGVTLDCRSHQCMSANVTNEGFLELRGVVVTGAGYAAAVNDVATGSASGSLTVLDSTIAGNTDNGQAGDGSHAGAISISGTSTAVAAVTVANSTIADNGYLGGGGAGGVFANLQANNSVQLINDTITGNSGEGGGPGGVGTPGTALHPLAASNTLIAGNTSSGQSPDCAGNLVDGSGAHNLIGDFTGCSGMTNARNGDLITVPSTGLNPIANNGGPTDTASLQPQSPAIGAGDPATCNAVPVWGSDQRSRPRRALIRGCDIGAYDTAGSGGLAHGTWYVALSGSGSACAANSQTQPFSTIEAALSCAQNGDVIILAPSGSTPYPGLGTVSHSVTIMAGPGGNAHSVRIDLSQPDDAAGSLFVPANASVVVRGVTLDCASHHCAQSNVTNNGALVLQRDEVTGAGYAAAVDNLTIGPVPARLSVLSSTIADNTNNGDAEDGSQAAGISSSTSDSGAVRAEPVVTVMNSTIAGNTFTGFQGAGAIFSDSHDNGVLTLNDDTIAGNSGSQEGGVTNSGGGASNVVASNTLIAGNTQIGANTPSDCQGAIGDGPGGHNLIGDASDCSGMTDGVNGDQIGVTQPGLHNTPAYNGGPTRTVALLSASPAIGHGDAPTCTSTAIADVDQRGLARHATTRGTCDIGAYDTGGHKSGSQR